MSCCWVLSHSAQQTVQMVSKSCWPSSFWKGLKPIWGRSWPQREQLIVISDMVVKIRVRSAKSEVRGQKSGEPVCSPPHFALRTSDPLLRARIEEREQSPIVDQHPLALAEAEGADAHPRHRGVGEGRLDPSRIDQTARHRLGRTRRDADALEGRAATHR